MASFFAAAHKCNVAEDETTAAAASLNMTSQSTGVPPPIANMYYDMKGRGILLEEARQFNVQKIMLQRAMRENEMRLANEERAALVQKQKNDAAAAAALLREAEDQQAGRRPTSATSDRSAAGGDGADDTRHPRLRWHKKGVPKAAKEGGGSVKGAAEDPSSSAPSALSSTSMVHHIGSVETADGAAPSAAINTSLISPMVLSHLTSLELRKEEAAAARDDRDASVLLPRIDFSDPFLPYVVEEQRERAAAKVIPKSITDVYTEWSGPAAGGTDAIPELNTLKAIKLVVSGGSGYKAARNQQPGSRSAVATAPSSSSSSSVFQKKSSNKRTPPPVDTASKVVPSPPPTPPEELTVDLSQTAHPHYHSAATRLDNVRQELHQEKLRLAQQDAMEQATHERFKQLRDVERQRVLAIAASSSAADGQQHSTTKRSIDFSSSNARATPAASFMAASKEATAAMLLSKVLSPSALAINNTSSVDVSSVTSSNPNASLMASATSSVKKSLIPPAMRAGSASLKRPNCLTSTVPAPVTDQSVLAALSSGLSMSAGRLAHPIDVYQKAVREDLLARSNQSEPGY